MPSVVRLAGGRYYHPHRYPAIPNDIVIKDHATGQHYRLRVSDTDLAYEELSQREPIDPTIRDLDSSNIHLLGVLNTDLFFDTLPVVSRSRAIRVREGTTTYEVVLDDGDLAYQDA